MRSNQISVLLALLAIAALAGCSGAGGDSVKAGVEIACSQRSDPRVKEMSDTGIGLTSTLGLAAGRYALPDTAAPTQLVVMFHGHGNDSCSWRNHLRQAAARGAVAIAMNYTGQRDLVLEPYGLVENYGWFMRAGAADSIAAAKYFLARYPTITQVFAMGISMGANASGVAVASPDAVRADGTPLFDYWVAVEGVHNLIEEYLIARGVAPFNAGAALAQQEIEEENGGALEDVPERYLEITNTANVDFMTGLKGVVLVHAVDDGLVPTNQSVEMAAALNAVGVPAHHFTVLGNGGEESGTTGTAIVAGPVFGAAGQEYESPFAGHGWEGSDTQIVIKTSFDQLFALMDGGTVEPGETPVPGI
jgi:hypothetical protein